MVIPEKTSAATAKADPLTIKQIDLPIQAKSRPGLLPIVVFRAFRMNRKVQRMLVIEAIGDLPLQTICQSFQLGTCCRTHPAKLRSASVTLAVHPSRKNGSNAFTRPARAFARESNSVASPNSAQAMPKRHALV